MLQVQKSITPGEALLYGRDPTPRIVGIHPLLDRTSAPHAVVRVYRRTAEGVLAEDDAFYPFFFLSDIELLRGTPRRDFRFQRLNRDNHFRYVAAFQSWGAYRNALRHVEQSGGDAGGGRPVHVVTSAAQQYLIQTGRTLFKEMSFDELNRMQLDIETYSERSFSNARRPEDRIILIALHDQSGWTHVIDGRDASEAEMLRQLGEIVRSRDPDVIEGHNILGFDFPYLIERARHHGVPLRLGRDGSAVRTFAANMRFAERSVDFTAVDIAGRHVIDTYLQVASYDLVKRDMPSHGLKAAARYFGLAAENRTYVRGSEIAGLWRTDPDRLVDYAIDDVIETERLARHLSGSTFYLTQMVPMPYGQAARTGPAAKIESLFIREYLRRKESLPSSESGMQTTGGYTDIFFTGVTGPIVYADVESLYPSIMLNYDVKPERDRIGVFQELLRHLTDLRIETKRRMKAAESESVRGELDARQSSYKILINSFYGLLGFGLALFNDYSEADRVAQTGQEILRQIIGQIRHDGGRVVEVDTDGVFFVPPADIRGKDAERQYVHHLTEQMPGGIRVGFEGRYRKMLSYKMKNYALLGYDGKLTFKGSSLVSRSTERFGREFVRRAIRLLLEEDVDALHELYLETRARIMAHDWKGVESFCRTETLKDPIDRYLKDVEEGRRSRAASYELAIRRARERQIPVRRGDRISFYVTGQSPTVTSFENARLASEWDSAAPDENTAFYLRRLDEFARKFEVFFLPHDFRLIFSPEDMFGFSSEHVRIQAHERDLPAAGRQISESGEAITRA